MDCPYCSQPGAKRVLFKVRCPNPACPAYEPSMTGGRSVPTPGALSAPISHPETAAGGDPSGPVPVHTSRKVPNRGAWSWVLWFAAYALFQIGKHGGTVKPLFWALAAFTALAAWGMGRQAKSDAESRSVEDHDRFLDERHRDLQDEREGPFDPGGERKIEVRYRNAKGEDKTFTGDRASLRRRKAHLTLRVAPEGIRIALRADRIANRAEVEGAIPG